MTSSIRVERWTIITEEGLLLFAEEIFSEEEARDYATRNPMTANGKRQLAVPASVARAAQAQWKELLEEHNRQLAKARIEATARLVEDAAHEAYIEEMEREQAELDKLPRVEGLSAVALDSECESCGKRTVLYARSAITLGYAGHPGAETTVFQICAACATGGRS